MQGFDCATTPADLETTLQLLHLYFTRHRFDQAALDRRLATLRESLVARHNMPFTYLQDTVVMRRGNYHPRSSALITDPADLDRVDMGQIRDICARAFDNPQQFNYVLTGTLDPEKVRPLVEKYIGSLSGARHPNSWRDVGRRPPKGHATADFERPMEEPISTILVEYTREVPEYDYRLSLAMALLQHVVEPRLTRVFREERGATYSVDMEGSASRLPVPILHLIVSFQTKPELLDGLRPLIDRELRALAAEGIAPEDFANAKEYMAKLLAQNQESNMYWAGRMKNYVRFGELYGDPVEVLESVGADYVHSLLTGLLDADNVLTVIMRPQ
jgi:zinc protease